MDQTASIHRSVTTSPCAEGADTTPGKTKAEFSVTRQKMVVDSAHCENCSWTSLSDSYALRGAKAHVAKTGHTVWVEHTRSNSIRPGQRPGAPPIDEKE